MSKLSDDAKRLIKYMPETINSLADAISKRFYDALIHGSQTRITNGDRIRSMTDEELVAWIFSIEPEECHLLKNNWNDYRQCKNCAVCLLDWLKQEVKE